jgi:hypothetical protein
MLARREFFQPADLDSPPPIGFALGAAFAFLAVCLLTSPSLRALLANQRHPILNLWRLVGAVFLMLMANGEVPALWALRGSAT